MFRGWERPPRASLAAMQVAPRRPAEQRSAKNRAAEAPAVQKPVKQLPAKNHAPAMALLGLCYEFGRGVDKDVKEAVKWYKKAAALGNASAKERLKKLEKDDEA